MQALEKSDDVGGNGLVGSPGLERLTRELSVADHTERERRAGFDAPLRIANCHGETPLQLRQQPGLVCMTPSGARVPCNAKDDAVGGLDDGAAEPYV